MAKQKRSISIEPIVHRRLKALAAERGETIGDTVSYLVILESLASKGGFCGASRFTGEEDARRALERAHVKEAMATIGRATLEG